MNCGFNLIWQRWENERFQLIYFFRLNLVLKKSNSGKSGRTLMWIQPPGSGWPTAVLHWQFCNSGKIQLTRPNLQHETQRAPTVPSCNCFSTYVPNTSSLFTFRFRCDDGQLVLSFAGFGSSNIAFSALQTFAGFVLTVLGPLIATLDNDLLWLRTSINSSRITLEV